MIHEGEDRIVPGAVRELGNEVHRYYLERKGVWGNWDTVQRRLAGVVNGFRLLAGRTPFYVLGRPFPHSGPPVMALKVPEGLIPSWVSGCWGVMVLSQDFSFERVHRGNNDCRPVCREQGLMEQRGLYPMHAACLLPGLHKGEVFLLGMGYVSF